MIVNIVESDYLSSENYEEDYKNTTFLSILGTQKVWKASSVRVRMASLWCESSLLTSGLLVLMVMRLSVTLTDSI